MLTGKQRYRQIKVKAKIIADRQLREFIAGTLDILPCRGDLEDELICREFDRMAAELRSAK